MNEDHIIQVDSYDFDDRISSSAALVYFYDHLEPVCRGFDSIIEELAVQYEERLPMLAIDTEQSPDIAARYDVENVPCVMLFISGSPVSAVYGANMPEVYSDMIEGFLPYEMQ